MDQITVGNLPVEITRKLIKNFYLRVYPGGRVCVTASIFQSEASIRRMIAQRMDWIQAKLQQYKLSPPPSPLEMRDGEIHPFLGREYQLKISEQARAVLRDEASMTLTLPLAPRERLQELLHLWYQKQLTFLLPTLLDKWEPIVGVKISGIRIKKMKSCWGSCNIAKRQITLNLELAKKPLECIEYVLVHELTHLHERLHNRRFWTLLEKFMPAWRESHQILHGKRSPWKCK
jgi:predicted metal-dependent hydrolase